MAFIEHGVVAATAPTFDDVKQFDKGNEVEIWIEGGEIVTTSPAHAKAEKIELKE
ncbi:DUF3221 domain-containing protein [Bacillus salinus]|uniref:DUF3221 domain-containing protein n=1 Tax=Bacillus sp. HMF5848 TaxID=2495421 RepID=UPI001639F69D|nr:DUF3221 domain-containing protein [Bacillus sp. HMF5848]